MVVGTLREDGFRCPFPFYCFVVSIGHVPGRGTMVVVFILFPNPKFNSSFLGAGSGAGDRLIVTYLSQVLFLGGDTRARALIVLVSSRVLI